MNGTKESGSYASLGRKPPLTACLRRLRTTARASAILLGLALRRASCASIAVRTFSKARVAELVAITSLSDMVAKPEAHFGMISPLLHHRVICVSEPEQRLLAANLCR